MKSSTTGKRPAAAIAIAAILAWLAIGGFGNAVVWRNVPDQLAGQAIPAPMHAFVEATRSPVFTLLAALYGITALVAAVGIFSLRTWKGIAYLAWCCAVLLLGVWIALAMPAQAGAAPRWLLLAFGIALAAVAACAYPFISRLQRTS